MADDDETEVERPPSEGVRIIGADEAAQALDRDDVVRRRSDDELKYGDRPTPPPVDGPQPALRFPLPSSESAEDIALPHWTDPPTGKVPAALGGDTEAGDDDWSSFASGGPRWRDSARDWDDDDVSFLAPEDEGSRFGALDDSERPSDSDYFAFRDIDEGGPAPAGRSVFAEAEDQFFAAEDDYEDDEAYYEDEDEIVDEGPRRVVIGSVRGSRGETSPIVPDSGGRDMSLAVGVGAGFGLVALILFSQGPAWALVLVFAVITVAAMEFFGAAQRAGHEPITLAGIAASAGLVLSAYHRLEAGIPAVLFITTVACLLWYLIGAGGTRAVAGVGVTLLGVVWVGVFGSYAALMLRQTDGIGVLLGAILATVAYDCGGLFVGRSMGRSPLSAASPNKTWEGLVGGCAAAFVVSCLIGVIGLHPWADFASGAKLGLVVAVVAPLGDLCQSMVKRDLGIKDMGTILPGHGGLMDRFDAMLFVLPAVFYLLYFL